MPHLSSLISRRTLSRRRHVAVLAAGLAAAGALNHVARRSGVTAPELAQRLPGDDLVPETDWDSTRGITIDAPRADVWPWIVQMGYPKYRAGWYTPYWLDRLQWGIHEQSSSLVRPELQQLKVGDLIPDSPDWSVYFTVQEVEPARARVLHSTRHVVTPVRAVDFSWAFVLA